METRTEKQTRKSSRIPAVESAVGSLADKPKRAAKTLRAMYVALIAAYGPQRWWPAETRFEMIVGAYLTQATSWRSVERSLENIRAAGLLGIEGIRNIPGESLRELIRPSGFVQRKAASLHAFVRFLDEHYGGSLDKLREQAPAVAREQLLALPGIGAETADAILLYALDHPAFVVDEYFRRVMTRHGLAAERASYEELQRLGELAVTSQTQRETALHANELHALIVEVGKRHCKRTAQCSGCPLQRFFT